MCRARSFDAEGRDAFNTDAKKLAPDGSLFVTG
jgi:hypothetical protein